MAREFEFVPLKLMYQQLQAKSHDGPHIGVWPFIKDIKQLPHNGSNH
jgi:hypothetical protein